MGGIHIGDIELEIFSQRIKELRISLNMTQKEFAAELGITPSALSSYEKNNINPSISIAKRIAEKYHVSIDWLCGLSEQENKEQLTTFSDLIKVFLQIDAFEDSKETLSEIKIETEAEEELPFFTDCNVLFSFSDERIAMFFKEWKKMREVHNLHYIDDDVYNLWIEKVIEKNKTILLKDMKRRKRKENEIPFH